MILQRITGFILTYESCLHYLGMLGALFSLSSSNSSYISCSSICSVAAAASPSSYNSSAVASTMVTMYTYLVCLIYLFGPLSRFKVGRDDSLLDWRHVLSFFYGAGSIEEVANLSSNWQEQQG